MSSGCRSQPPDPRAYTCALLSYNWILASLLGPRCTMTGIDFCQFRNGLFPWVCSHVRDRPRAIALRKPQWEGSFSTFHAGIYGHSLVAVHATVVTDPYSPSADLRDLLGLFLPQRDAFRCAWLAEVSRDSEDLFRPSFLTPQEGITSASTAGSPFCFLYNSVISMSGANSGVRHFAGLCPLIMGFYDLTLCLVLASKVGYTQGPQQHTCALCLPILCPDAL